MTMEMEGSIQVFASDPDCPYLRLSSRRGLYATMKNKPKKAIGFDTNELFTHIARSIRLGLISSDPR